MSLLGLNVLVDVFIILIAGVLVLLRLVNAFKFGVLGVHLARGAVASLFASLAHIYVHIKSLGLSLLIIHFRWQRHGSSDRNID